MQASGAPPRLGIILDTFPRVSERFVAREIEDLAGSGFVVRIAAFHSPSPNSGEKCNPPRCPVKYRPPLHSLSFWKTAHTELRHFRFWQIAAYLVREAVAHLPAGGGRVLLRATTAIHPLRAVGNALLTAAWMAPQFRYARIEHVHAHFTGLPATTARITAALLGVGYSLSLHGGDLNPSPLHPAQPDDSEAHPAQPGASAAHPVDPLESGNVIGARFVVCCTAANRDRLRLRYPAQSVYLVRHGIDLDRFTPDPIEQNGQHSREPAAIVTVSRLVAKKGIDILLHATARLRNQGVHLSLDVLGEGPERTRLEAQIRELQLTGAVRLWGEQSEDEVIAALHRATLFVLPCRDLPGDRDGVPNAIVEAMAAGVPVVATTAGAVREIIDHQHTGWLTPPDSVDLLADAIEHALSHPDDRERVARAGRRFVESEYNRRNGAAAAVFRQALAPDNRQPADDRGSSAH